jgi:hypothetical protein
VAQTTECKIIFAGHIYRAAQVGLPGATNSTCPSSSAPGSSVWQAAGAAHSPGVAAQDQRKLFLVNGLTHPSMRSCAAGAVLAPYIDWDE